MNNVCWRQDTWHDLHSSHVSSIAHYTEFVQKRWQVNDHSRSDVCTPTYRSIGECVEKLEFWQRQNFQYLIWDIILWFFCIVVWKRYSAVTVLMMLCSPKAFKWLCNCFQTDRCAWLCFSSVLSFWVVDCGIMCCYLRSFSLLPFRRWFLLAVVNRWS